jgi:hypothetical protein
MQAGSVVGVADIHARPLAHRIQALQDLDGIGVVAFAVAGRSRRNIVLVVGHHASLNVIG